MVRSKPSPHRRLTGAELCDVADLGASTPPANAKTQSQNLSKRASGRLRKGRLPYPPPLPRPGNMSCAGISESHLANARRKMLRDCSLRPPSIAGAVLDSGRYYLNNILPRPVLVHEWMPRWETYTGLPVDAFIPPTAIAMLLVDEILLEPGDRLDSTASSPGSVHVRHMAPECYIGTSKPSYYHANAFAQASRRWRHFSEYKSSLTHLEFRITSEIGEPLKAVLDTKTPFAPVAITCLVYYNMLQIRYERGRLFFCLIDKLHYPQNTQECGNSMDDNSKGAGNAFSKDFPQNFTSAQDSERIHVALGVFFRWALNRAHGAELLEESALSINWLYDAVRRTSQDDDCDEYIPFLENVARSSNVLRAKLRPYQERAVAWMLSREHADNMSSGSEMDPWVCFEPVSDDWLSSIDDLHLVQSMCFNPCTGEYILGQQHPPVAIAERDSYRTKGGLLCEQMGLGKTVEVIALVLSNPRNISFTTSPLFPDVAKLETVPCVECEGPVNVQEHPSCSYPSRQTKRQKSNSGVYDQPTCTSAWVICRECYKFAHRTCSQLGFSEQSLRKGFVCQQCLQAFESTGGRDTLVQSKATLIVVPQMLLGQWIDELGRHGPEDLDIIVFDGLSGRSGYVGLHLLASADVVLTSYDALRSDVAVLAQMRSSRTLRRPKRYRATPTPLLAVNWWRICLDEAQMVESGASSQAKMAKELSSELRWCVTGTPARHDICELGELLSFLRVNPCIRPARWSLDLVGPAEFGAVNDRARLRRTLRRLMWRTCKDDVDRAELHLPEQTTEVVRLEFGPIEKYFYSDIWEQVRDDIIGNSESLRSRDKGITFGALQRLRQACCHPQVGASRRRVVGDSNFGRSRHRNRQHQRSLCGVRKSRKIAPALAAQMRAENPLSMSEVLDSMVSKARIECQEAQRVMIAAGNGLAGILLLQGGPTNLSSTVGLYREVLQLSSKDENICEVDRIQILHVLHNLKDALRIITDTPHTSTLREKTAVSQADVISPREANIDGEIKQLKDDYLLDARSRLAYAMSVFRDARHKADTLCKRLDGNCRGIRGGFDGFRWWSIAIGFVMEQGDPKMFLERLVRELMDALPLNSGSVDTIAHRLISLPAIATVLSSSLEQIRQARKSLLDCMEQLPGAVEPTSEQIAESGQCKSCRAFDVQGTECTHCRSEHLLVNYERLLYHVQGPSIAEKRKFFDNDFGTDSSYSGYPEFASSELVSPGRTNKCSPKSESATLRRNMTEALRPRRRPQLATFVAPVRSEVERIMRVLAVIVRSGGNAEAINEMRLWFEMLDAVKKEFSACKIAFDAQREFLGACDELDQAMQRMSLVDDDLSRSQLSPHQQLFTLSSSMLPALRAEFTADKSAADVNFRTKRSDLMYLMSLARDQERSDKSMSGCAGTTESDAFSTSCPICLGLMGSEIALFSCGHRFCSQCTRVLIGRCGHRGIKFLSCPTCRRHSLVENVYFISSKASQPAEYAKEKPADDAKKETASTTDGCVSTKIVLSAFTRRPSTNSQQVPELYPGEHCSSFHDFSIPVLGSNSSKLNAVIRVLRGIWRRDENAKALIFSQWNEVLHIVANVLRENQIEFSSLVGCSFRGRTEGSAATILRGFKTSLSCNVLLLPFARGAAGLNLVEATHVILVEPSLNPAIESQAVSRVHRLSQTRSTFVHRLIINNTVEDSVRKIAVSRQQTAVESTGEETVTEDEVMELLTDQDVTGETTL